MGRLFLRVLAAATILAGCQPDRDPAGPEPAAGVAALGPSGAYTRVRLPLQDAWAVNDRGTIVGYVKGVGAWWSNGQRRVLPSPAAPYSSYYAGNVSEDDRMVGASYYAGKYRALYWAAPTFAPIDLGHLGSGSAQALDVNSSGVVVGVSRAPYAGDEWHAVRWQKGGALVDIHPPGYLTSTALRINDNGVIVGFADMATPGYHRDAIRWEPNGTITVIQATTSGISSGAYGLNAMGDASGQNPSFGPTIWFSDGTTRFFPSSLGAQSARGVNGKYRMVGYYQDPNNQIKPWTSVKGVEMTLPVAANESGSAADVNECGWIVGWSYFGATMTGTLWQPAACD